MKIIKVTYGLKGKDQREYTYLVENNVRPGQVVFPSVKHYESGKIFGTVGIVQKTANEQSREGSKLKSELFDKGVKPAQAITGTDLQSKPKSQRGEGFGETIKGENGLYKGTEKSINQYKPDSVRAERNKEAAAQARTYTESYEDYYKKFNGGN